MNRSMDWWMAAVAGAAGVLLIGPRLPAPVGPRMAAAAVSFVSLCAESLPFLVAGATIAWILRRRGAGPLVRLARRRPGLALVMAPLVGTALPLCDCGIMPLSRELRDAGVPGRVVTAFAAGAPLTNPIVIASTALAFGGSAAMVLGRVAVGVAVAVVTALVGPAAPQAGEACAADHDHGHDGGSGLAATVGAELAAMGPALVLGALVAGGLRALAPAGALSVLASQPLVAAGAMMALAAVLSLCSQADAFVAISLPVGNLGRLAFLVMGPICNLRTGAMYRRSFGTRWVLAYARTAAIATLVLSGAWITWGLH